MIEKIKTSSETLVADTHLLDIGDGIKVNYTEYCRPDGTVIDVELRTDEGMPLTDGHLLHSDYSSVADLLDHIQHFLWHGNDAGACACGEQH